MGKTVWILGAGFSRALGGPLLTELFSPGSALKMKTCFPKLPRLQGDDAQLARLLFQDKDGPKQWENAEEFLDYLDTAQLGGEEAPSYQALIEMIDRLKTIGSLSTGDLIAAKIKETLKAFKRRLSRRDLIAAKIKPVAEMSRRLLAAECSAFLVGADVDSEKWAPYRRWADKVERGDVVITFNYDLVPERLAKWVAHTTPGSEDKFEFLCPPRECCVPGRVNVLKLHGSTNWRQDRGQQALGIFGASPVPDNDYFALDCPEENMVIASPGPSKFASSAGGTLGPLWLAASTALKTADAIVFVGYRFPPTDSAARRILIDAIGENEKPHLVLHTVLGPKVHDDHSERLKGMLEAAVERKGRVTSEVMRNSDPIHGPRYRWLYDLNQHALWAEDFLDLCDPTKLYPHT